MDPETRLQRGEKVARVPRCEAPAKSNAGEFGVCHDDLVFEVAVILADSHTERLAFQDEFPLPPARHEQRVAIAQVPNVDTVGRTQSGLAGKYKR